jgi:hypothetical protein
MWNFNFPIKLPSTKTKGMALNFVSGGEKTLSADLLRPQQRKVPSLGSVIANFCEGTRPNS